MERSLCQLTLAIIMATCLLLQSAGVHCAPASDALPSTRHRQSLSSMDTYMLLKALLTPDSERLAANSLYNIDDMERSRRGGPVIETFEPVSFGVLRRLMKSRLAEQENENHLGRVEANSDFFRTIGRR